MFFNKFLSKLIIDFGIINIINKFLGKLDYKFNYILNVIGEFGIYKNFICEYFC